MAERVSGVPAAGELSAEEQAKREALAGYVLDFTHQDEWPVAELRRAWDVAWAAAASYDAFRERERQREPAQQPVQTSAPACPHCHHRSSAQYPIVATTAALSEVSGQFIPAGTPTYLCTRCCRTWPQEMTN